jgi:hypothetical protein
VPQQSTNDDISAIRELIRTQARRLSWAENRPADWDGFRSGFHPAAHMIASARPARPQSVDEFLGRMKDLSQGSLRSFAEKALGGKVFVFGNIAVALVAGETIENGRETNRDVSGYLLVKEDGRWRIAAQAWDKERPEQKIPPTMLIGE